MLVLVGDRRLAIVRGERRIASSGDVSEGRETVTEKRSGGGMAVYEKGRRKVMIYEVGVPDGWTLDSRGWRCTAMMTIGRLKILGTTDEGTCM
ncbi:hypothetical protein Taro_033182 [Colocasia esculenta]|uniref:Uncharacterized protein n=1 Tax=Colocasia esculenta TaxID=4460 RepID=A0A843W416_COLES|nr:hypothetical protein [Colocasia esculenta]